MPLAGLGQAAKSAAAPALREVADTYKVQVSGPVNINTAFMPSDKVGIHGLQIKVSSKTLYYYLHATDTKLPNVVLSGSGNNIFYSFGLYTPEVHTVDRWKGTFTTGFGQLGSNPFEHEIFSLSTEDNNAFTLVESVPSIASQLGEGYDYSILKASVPSVKDGAKDATLYAELWTDYASAGENDYMVGCSGGCWSPITQPVIIGLALLLREKNTTPVLVSLALSRLLLRVKPHTKVRQPVCIHLQRMVSSAF